jgi:hypothetical protein
MMTSGNGGGEFSRWFWFRFRRARLGRRNRASSSRSSNDTAPMVRPQSRTLAIMIPHPRSIPTWCRARSSGGGPAGASCRAFSVVRSGWARAREAAGRVDREPQARDTLGETPTIESRRLQIPFVGRSEVPDQPARPAALESGYGSTGAQPAEHRPAREDVRPSSIDQYSNTLNMAG